MPEKFFAMLWRRCRGLVEKFVSVKGLFTLQCSLGYFAFGRPVPTWLFAASWVLFIGGRYVDKFIELKGKLTLGGE